MDSEISLSDKRNTNKIMSLIQGERSDSPEPSGISTKSNCSMGQPLYFKDGGSSPDQKFQKNKLITNRRNKIDALFKDLELKLINLLKNELRSFIKLLGFEDPSCSVVESDKDQSIRDGLLKITVQVLRDMNQTDLATTLQNRMFSESQNKHKSKLRDKYKRINEGISQSRSSALLNEIYTELHITEGWSAEINKVHKVRQIEAASRRPASQEIPIKYSDLFKEPAIRTVLTEGVAGIGKTVLVQKFILDWAEGGQNQDVTFMFPLPFRELNLIKQKNLSLMELLHHFYPEIGFQSINWDFHKVLIIFDGLDECRFPLNFQNNQNLCDVTEPASVDVLLTNLIKGNLLSSALIWITSRPGAANQIPPEYVHQVTEVRGFSDPQKEIYFRKKIKDQSLSSKIISHIKSSRSLYIMCHIPVFCWITASVLERMLGGAEGGEVPKTLTQMFTHFLIFQIKHKNQKYQKNRELDLQQIRENVLALGKLAFQQLEKGNLIFYEEDLRDCGIDVAEAAVYSGVCTQIFIQEPELHLGKVFSFVHLSVQEFLAALFTFVCFIENKAPEPQTSDLSDLFNMFTMSEFLKSAVNKTLQSQNGHLDLFLRFLLGLSLESNQNLLRELLPQTGSGSYNEQETVQYIKKKINEELSPEKSINLLHCLNEMNDKSLVQEVQTYLRKEGTKCLHKILLSPAQWSALVFVLLNSDQQLEKFALWKYDRSEECFLKLLPVVKVSRSADLCSCNLSGESCSVLASVLILNPCSLKHLDLSFNKIKDSGVELLSDGLKNPNCKLEILQLRYCKLSGESCSVLSSVLSLNPSLKYLDLSNNKLKDSGVKLLSDGLKDPHCKLEILQLSNCNLSGESCSVLSSVLSLNSCGLKHLNISLNKLKDSGVKLLSDGLKSPHCELEILQLYNCNLSAKSCSVLASVLRSNSCSLKYLDLSFNKLEDLGVKLLSDGLKSPHCKLEILQLEQCGFTEKGFVALNSALRSNTASVLREMNLCNNKPGESERKHLTDLQKAPQCNLQILQLDTTTT